MPYRLSALAERDLEEIWSYVPGAAGLLAASEWPAAHAAISLPVHIPGSRYLSESVNPVHASAGTLSVKPSRSVVSRTGTMPLSLAVSTQDPPLPSE